MFEMAAMEIGTYFHDTRKQTVFFASDCSVSYENLATSTHNKAKSHDDHSGHSHGEDSVVPTIVVIGIFIFVLVLSYFLYRKYCVGKENLKRNF